MITRQPLLVTEKDTKGLKHVPIRDTMLSGQHRAKRWAGAKPLGRKAKKAAEGLKRQLLSIQQRRYWQQRTEEGALLARTSLVLEGKPSFLGRLFGKKKPAPPKRGKTPFKKMAPWEKAGVSTQDPAPSLGRGSSMARSVAPPSERKTQQLQGPQQTQIVRSAEMKKQLEKGVSGIRAKARQERGSTKSGFKPFSIPLHSKSGSQVDARASTRTAGLARSSQASTASESPLERGQRIARSIRSRRSRTGAAFELQQTKQSSQELRDRAAPESPGEERAQHGDHYVHQMTLSKLHGKLHKNLQQARESGDKEAHAQARGHLDTFYKQHGRMNPWDRLKKAADHFKKSLEPDKSGSQRKVYLTRPHDSQHWQNPSKYSIGTEEPGKGDPHHTVHVASRALGREPLLYEFQSSFAPGTSILGAPATKGATTTANLGLVTKGGEVFLGKKQLDKINKRFKTQEACYKWAGKNRKKQEKCDEIPTAVGGVMTGMAMLKRSKLGGI